jgi:hypothetical protein
MLTLTVLLLVTGSLLAALGTAGFTIVIYQPGSSDELASARKTATVGRWMTAIGLLMLWAGPVSVSGPAGAATTLAAVLAAATILTKSTIRPAATTGVAR